MYEQHFGLTSRPFKAVSTGADVFVGPQTAKIMQAIKLAMSTSDAVITVMGPAGIGKSTIVGRALSGLDGQKLIVRIARMKLAHDEILEFLLEEFQAANIPASTIRKVSLFRELVADRTAAGMHVAIVVEDATRIGEDALAELEALTSSDGVEYSGATLVLMGDETLRDQLDVSGLARLKQRVRAYQFVNPLSAPELGAYMKHCFRLAGGDYDRLFEESAAGYIHALTGGNPRTTNNLLEAVLNAASARSLTSIENTFIAEIAGNEFGMSAELPAASEAVTAAPEITESPATSDEPDSANDAVDDEPAATDEVAEDDLPADVVSSNDDTAPNLEDIAASLSALESSGVQTDETPTPEVIAEAPPPESPPQPDLDSVAAALDILEAGDNATEGIADDEPPTEAPNEPVAESVESQEEDIDIGATSTELPRLTHATLPDLEAMAPELATVIQNLEEETGSDIPMLEASANVPIIEAVTAVEPEPELEIVAEEPAEAVNEVAADIAEAAADDDEIPSLALESDAIPDLAMNDESAAPLDLAEAPDPTLAELQPDMDILEEALAASAAEDPVEEPSTPVVDVEPAAAPEAQVADVPTSDVPDMPAITLDAAIQENIAEATAALEKHDATIREKALSEDAVASAEPASQNKDISETDIKKIASGIRKAVSLEDVDDRMAETLFGAEFSAIAAQVIANPPPTGSANQDMAVATGSTEPQVTVTADELSLVEDSIAAKPAPASESPNSKASSDSPMTDNEKAFQELYGQAPVEVSLESNKSNPGLDLSASQRLATVRALNASQLPPGAMPPAPAKPKPAAPESQQPQPIEEQISTSMTATLKALSIRPDSANDEDDEEEQPKKGFFSRFRRS